MRRLLDFFVLAIFMPIFLPVIAIAYFVKYFFDGKPVFYNSVRIGKRSVPFLVFKFRTMVNDRLLISDEVKKYSEGGFESIPLSSNIYTTIGRFYERTQLVETPQIINIIRGDMSFVGYRPLPATHCDLLAKNVGDHLSNLRAVHQPGLTGMAQLFGKSNLTYMERVQIEINEGIFYDLPGFFIHKFILYFYSLVGTAFYVVFGRAPLIKFCYKHIVVKKVVNNVC